MNRISGSGSGWPDIRPFFLIRFWLRFRPKWYQIRYRISQPDSTQSFLWVQSVSSALQEESLLNIQHDCCLIMQKG